LDGVAKARLVPFLLATCNCIKRLTIETDLIQLNAKANYLLITLDRPFS